MPKLRNVGDVPDLGVRSYCDETELVFCFRPFGDIGRLLNGAAKCGRLQNCINDGPKRTIWHFRHERRHVWGNSSQRIRALNCAPPPGLRMGRRLHSLPLALRTPKSSTNTAYRSITCHTSSMPMAGRKRDCLTFLSARLNGRRIIGRCSTSPRMKIRSILILM